jgi:carbon monoxide dehydrogenase subunit G
MASIRKEFQLPVSAQQAWDAFKDLGAVHTRLAPGFVTDCKLEGEARMVSFANGFTTRELIVDVDHKARRLAYAARSERLAHHNASFQVFAEGDGSRVVWIADVLPHEAGKVIGAMMDEGVAAMKKHLSKG